MERKSSDALGAQYRAAPRTRLASRALGVDRLVMAGAAVEEGECCERLHGVVLRYERGGFPFVVSVPYQILFGQSKSKLVNIR